MTEVSNLSVEFPAFKVFLSKRSNPLLPKETINREGVAVLSFRSNLRWFFIKKIVLF
jgi:hypothetical protein